MMLLSNYLPEKINKVLFGDRSKFGYEVDYKDKDWIEWESVYYDFYSNTQKKGVGKYVNDSGYKIFKEFNFQDKVILEIGPGSLPHLNFMNGTPSKYIMVDVDENILIKNRQDPQIPNIKNNSLDAIVTFYSLEHLYPLEPFLNEYEKYLKKDGVIIGAVPCEGGLAWGLGRFLTSRRWLKKNTTLNPVKIICWEHPNFISLIKDLLDDKFEIVKNRFFPLRVKSGDFNLVYSFIYKKKSQ